MHGSDGPRWWCQGMYSTFAPYATGHSRSQATKLLNHLILPLTWLLVVQTIERCHPLPHGKRTTVMTTRLDLLPVTTMTEGVGSAITSVVGAT